MLNYVSKFINIHYKINFKLHKQILENAKQILAKRRNK